MKNRTKGEIIAARARDLWHMCIYGLIPTHQILDNEASERYKESIRESIMTYQLVPLDDYRRNIAERAIQFWKNHFISVLSGVSATFFLQLWCQVIPQAEKKLLLLRKSNVKKNISSYSHLYVNHNYSAIPFVPIRM